MTKEVGSLVQLVLPRARLAFKNGNLLAVWRLNIKPVNNFRAPRRTSIHKVIFHLRLNSNKVWILVTLLFCEAFCYMII